MKPKDLNILIIDDSPEDRVTYRRMLKSYADYDYQFQEAETGDDGLLLCKNERPDCILLDYNLPDMDGLELLEQMSEKAHRHRAPIVMLTGQGSEQIAVQAMKGGAQEYLVKNAITPHSLHRAVHNAIDRLSLLKRLDEQRRALQRSNRDLQEFASVVSHDLKSPLQSVMGFLMILRGRYKDKKLDEEALDYITHAIDAAIRMNRLIEDVLAYSRLEASAKHMKQLDLNGIVQEVISDLEARIAQTGATFDIGALPTIEAHPIQMHQLFLNLLGNAIKFHREGVPPEIKIRSRPMTGTVPCLPADSPPVDLHEIRIEDNGIGFDDEYADAIFGFLHRLHDQQKYEGTGLGLAVARKIVERHCGTIKAQSTVGAGSVFTIIMPLEQIPDEKRQE